MNTIEAIKNRRSIRRFKSVDIPREEINKIVTIALEAPSGKNNQPWRLFAVDGEKKREFETVMEQGIKHAEELGYPTHSAGWTLGSIRQASTIILIHNVNSKRETSYEGPQKYMWSVDTQSIGGMIQTMLLAAEDMGYGTLWICDTFYADYQISNWLCTDMEMVAAVAIGVRDESPDARPRKSLEEVMVWK